MSDTATITADRTDVVRNASVQPILPGMHPDPTLCRVGEDYYLATSSFEYFPGAPIFHSRDLREWTQIGNILTDRSQFRDRVTGPSTGIWGPTLRHHDGRFWFVTTNISDFDSGQLIVHATDPAGPWSEPIFVPEAVGIDPDLCWDGDTAYLSWHVFDFARGGQGIRQAPVDLATGRLLDAPYPIWQGSGQPTAEGPHLFRVGEYWYQFVAEGGTERGHCVSVARARSLRGPWEPCPDNPLLTRRSIVHPVQSTGHADLVQTPDGSWAAVYLGVRPAGSTPGYHVLGRETFLASVEWIDGWPVLVPDHYEVPVPDTSFDDDFTGDRLHPRWVVPLGEPRTTAERLAEGGLRFPSADGDAVLCARVQDVAFTASADIRDAGTLGVRLDRRHRVQVSVKDGVARARAWVGDAEWELGAAEVGNAALLRVQAQGPRASSVPPGLSGPDEIVVSVVHPDGAVELGRIDGRYLSTEVASGFTGRMLYLGSPRADGRIERIDYRPEAG